MDVIERTINYAPGSFIEELHCNSNFDGRLFNEVIFAICELIKKSYQNKLTDLNYFDKLKKILRIYRSFSAKLIYHFSTTDLYEINNLPREYSVFFERFSFVLECFLNKDYGSLEEYIDDLGKLDLPKN